MTKYKVGDIVKLYVCNIGQIIKKKNTAHDYFDIKLIHNTLNWINVYEIKRLANKTERKNYLAKRIVEVI